MRIVFGIISLIALIFIGSGIYNEIYKNKISQTRLKCHGETTVFEKFIKPSLYKQTKEDIQKGALTLKLSSHPSIYAKSTLFNYITLNNIKDMLKKQLNIKNLNAPQDTMIDIYVYENDRDDPNKKSSSCKFYRGYLVLTFVYKENPIYKIQIDFYDKEGKDIQKSLKCALKSFDTLENQDFN